MTTRKKPTDLRSHRWYGVDTLRAFGHRSRTLQIGFTREEFAGKPVIALVNTWSDINPCHTHLRQRAEEVKRGIWQAGGFPVEIPALTLSEMFQKPTTMMYRNLLAMETEEILRSYPADGCVLLGGCDKTVPALLMGAISMDLPTIFMPAGPMLRGNWRGKTLGSGSDVWKYHTELRAGNITQQDWDEIEGGIARSFGTCMTFGTASTMACIAEVLGLILPGGATIPSPDSNHVRLATLSGKRIVEMVWEDLKPSDILSRASFENAIRVMMAGGGSTNAVIHIVALARRAGIDISLADFDRISRTTPVTLNLRPSGQYLMEDLFYAGGSEAFFSSLGDLLQGDVMTCTGRTLGENIANAPIHLPDVIRPLTEPLEKEGGVAILYGNLAPGGAVIKTSAATPGLLTHTGPAVVFDDYNELERRLDDPDLVVDENSVLVLRSAGPQGGPGMPEWGMLPLPKKLLERGVRDMLRISDARMSGTSYGTVVLHISPESFVGGPLALVREGDLITLDVPGRKLQLEVSDEELAERRAAWQAPARKYGRGYGELYAQHVEQAEHGCDFDFLARDGRTADPEIH
ncbi:MAG: dihydroxy-acid dehydratase [Burkholderiaceae bacterium]|nr:dihydroxy-acid dehydratase [Burkholderiaceae bacterium]